MRILLSFILILFAMSAFGTTYTTIGSGDWDDANTWLAKMKPPDNIPVGDVVVINATNIVRIHTDMVNNGTITLNSSAFFIRRTGTFTNAGTITLNRSVIGTEGTGTFTNVGTITLDNTSAIASYGTSTFTNNSTITLDNTSYIITLDMSTFYTSDPTPEFSNLPFPTTGNNGSRIFDFSGANATLAAPPSVPSAPIPTLSEWGLILLSMCLSIFGLVGIRQRVMS